MRQDRGRGTQDHRQRFQENKAQHANEHAGGQCEKEARGRHSGSLLHVLTAQLPRDEIPAAMAEEKAYRLYERHKGKHHPYGARCTVAQHSDKKGVRHVVERRDKHTDDTGQRQTADQTAHRGLGHEMMLLYLLFVHFIIHNNPPPCNSIFLQIEYNYNIFPGKQKDFFQKTPPPETSSAKNGVPGPGRRVRGYLRFRPGRGRMGG